MKKRYWGLLAVILAIVAAYAAGVRIAPLGQDFDAAPLRLCARQSDDAGQVRRLLALAAIYDGASRAEAAEIGGVTRQIV